MLDIIRISNIKTVAYFSDAKLNVGFEERLFQILSDWIFEASISFGLGNLQRLSLPLLIIEKSPIQGKKLNNILVNNGRLIRRQLMLSINYSMNGKCCTVGQPNCNSQMRVSLVLDLIRL